MGYQSYLLSERTRHGVTLAWLRLWGRAMLGTLSRLSRLQFAISMWCNISYGSDDMLALVGSNLAFLQFGCRVMKVRSWPEIVPA